MFAPIPMGLNTRNVHDSSLITIFLAGIYSYINPFTYGHMACGYFLIHYSIGYSEKSSGVTQKIHPSLAPKSRV